MNDVLKVAVIGGDGTGPEVVAEGVKVLKKVAELENFKVELTPFDLSGNRYLKTGVIITGRAPCSMAVSAKISRQR